MNRRIDEAYDNYADMLYRLALTYMQNSEDAADAVQDVFVKYMTAAPFLRDEEHERAWLIRVTVNRCCDLLRRRKIRSYVSLDEITETAAEEPELDSSDVMRCLAKIPEKNRAAIVLHHLEGFSVDEVSRMLGISQSAVKMRLARGRDALKDLLSMEE
ncbi:MAG: RNA polymerase sigma factor [Clostridia bacterium]|nr:RNA polymerase sigma factor [Clostridia bacterium]MBQ8368369.1 RNA polymerase sigma factor [Clostridia bacterium]